VAKQKFVHFIPRDKPPKRKGVHKKSQYKSVNADKKIKTDIWVKVGNEKN